VDFVNAVGLCAWSAGTPVFVSLKLLSTLIAAQYDCDPRDLFEKNRLYLWGSCQAFFSGALARASKLGVEEARAALVAHTKLSTSQLHKMLRWQEVA